MNYGTYHCLAFPRQRVEAVKKAAEADPPRLMRPGVHWKNWQNNTQAT